MGNLELLGTVSERLEKVHDRMDGVSGDLLRLILEIKKELTRIGNNSMSLEESSGKKRGRPSKTKEIEPSPARNRSTPE